MRDVAEILSASECRIYRLSVTGWDAFSKGYGWLTLSRNVATNMTELKVTDGDEVLLAMPMASNMEPGSPDGRHCSFKQPATPNHYLLRFRDEKTCAEFLDVFRKEMSRAEPLIRPHSTSSTSLQEIPQNPVNAQKTPPSEGDTAKGAEPPAITPHAPEVTRAFFSDVDAPSAEWSTDGEGPSLVDSLTSSFANEPSGHSFEAITYHDRPGQNDQPAATSSTAAKKISLEFRAREAELNDLKLENQMLRQGLVQSQENVRQWEKELQIGRQNFSLQLSRLQQAVSAAEGWRQHLGESKEGMLAAQAMARELVLAIEKMHATTKLTEKQCMCA